MTISVNKLEKMRGRRLQRDIIFVLIGFSRNKQKYFLLLLLWAFGLPPTP